MKFSHFRDILAVAETGSLRAAGRHLGIAQPAITRSIREIEQELGVTLFERHAKGVRLTEMGQVFVRRAQAIQSEIRRAREEVEQLKGQAIGEVSIAVSTASSMSLMPSAIATFRKRYPDVVLKITESFFQPIETEILSGRIDFYVGPLDQSNISSQFAVEKLFDNYRMVVARKGHNYRSARSLADLMDARWLRPALSDRSTEGDLEVAFERLGLPAPNIVVHARSALITLLTVANSDLLTILPQQWIEFPLTANLVEPLQLDEGVMTAAPMCIARRQDMPLTPVAEYLCDLMRRAGEHFVHRRDQAGGVPQIAPR